MDVTKPYKMWFGAMDVTKPYKCIRFGGSQYIRLPSTCKHNPSQGAVAPACRALVPSRRQRPSGTLCYTLVLSVLKAKIKIENPRIRADIGPTPTISL